MKYLTIIAAIALSGCISMTAAGEYKGQMESKQEYQGTVYKVKNHPTNQSLLIAAPLGKQFKSGFVFGAPVIRKSVYMGVAASYLEGKCKPLEAEQIIEEYYEVTFSCA